MGFPGDVLGEVVDAGSDVFGEVTEAGGEVFGEVREAGGDVFGTVTAPFGEIAEAGDEVFGEIAEGDFGGAFGNIIEGGLETTGSILTMPARVGGNLLEGAFEIGREGAEGLFETGLANLRGIASVGGSFLGGGLTASRGLLDALFGDGKPDVPEIDASAVHGTSDEWIDQITWVLDHLNALAGPYSQWRGTAPAIPVDQVERLRGIAFGVMSRQGNALTARSTTLGDAFYPVTDAGSLFGSWQGQAADRFAGHLGRTTAAVTTVRDDLSAVGISLGELSTALQTLVREFTVETNVQVGGAVQDYSPGELSQSIEYVRSWWPWLTGLFGLAYAAALIQNLDRFADAYEAAVQGLTGLAQAATNGIEESSSAFSSVVSAVETDPFAGLEVTTETPGAPNQPTAPPSTTPPPTGPQNSGSPGGGSPGGGSPGGGSPGGGSPGGGSPGGGSPGGGSPGGGSPGGNLAPMPTPTPGQGADGQPIPGMPGGPGTPTDPKDDRTEVTIDDGEVEITVSGTDGPQGVADQVTITVDDGAGNPTTYLIDLAKGTATELPPGTTAPGVGSASLGMPDAQRPATGTSPGIGAGGVPAFGPTGAQADPGPVTVREGDTSIAVDRSPSDPGRLEITVDHGDGPTTYTVDLSGGSNGPTNATLPTSTSGSTGASSITAALGGPVR